MRLAKLSLTSGILLFGISIIAPAQDRYVPQTNEELYGTWTNDTVYMEKRVCSPGQWIDYGQINDSEPINEGTSVIDAKWKDSEGNVFYQIRGTVTSGKATGLKFQWLAEISKAGTVMEYNEVIVAEFDPQQYPERVGLGKSPLYNILYRSNK